MGQANAVHTTRRALFGAAVAIPALALAGSVKSDPWAGWAARVERAPPTPEELKRKEFAKSLAWMHPDGARAAERILAAGMNPDDCTFIILHLTNPAPGELPAVMFKTASGGSRTFRPRGEDL